MQTCYECAKQIGKKQKSVFHIPSNLEISLGVDFARTYHARCYEVAEELAFQEFKKQRTIKS